MESITVGRWMEAKILELRRNRKKEIFGFSLLVRRDFGKIGSDGRKRKNLFVFFLNGIHNHREMDVGKNPQAKTERKKEIFEFPLLIRQDFGKIGSRRKK